MLWWLCGGRDKKRWWRWSGFKGGGGGVVVKVALVMVLVVMLAVVALAVVVTVLVVVLAVIFINVGGSGNGEGGSVDSRGGSVGGTGGTVHSSTVLARELATRTNLKPTLSKCCKFSGQRAQPISATSSVTKSASGTQVARTRCTRQPGAVLITVRITAFPRHGDPSRHALRYLNKVLVPTVIKVIPLKTPDGKVVTDRNKQMSHQVQSYLKL